MEISFFDPTELTPFIKNPKKHPQKQIDMIKKSIETFGFYQPIIAIKEGGMVVCGHARREAAIQLGITKVPVIVLDMSYEKAVACVIADNRLAALGVDDIPLLKENFSTVLSIPDFDIEAIGYDLDEVQALMTIDDSGMGLCGEPGEVVEDEFNPDEVKETRCKEGDLWALGSHRLLCGDSTNKEDVIKLTNGVKADMAFSDPPYNLHFEYNEYDDSKSYNEYKQFCKKWFDNLLTFSNGNAIITPGKQNIGMWYDIKKWTDLGVWVAKNKMSGGKISHLSLFEPIIFYGKFDRSSRATDLFEYNVKQQTDTGDHTCPKIINFIADLIESYSKKGDTWLELFGGSGTTLIACEQTGRISLNLELDPHYCDIIISRWEQFTGQTAKKLN